jgi:hypothetical protein
LGGADVVEHAELDVLPKSGLRKDHVL